MQCSFRAGDGASVAGEAGRTNTSGAGGSYPSDPCGRIALCCCRQHSMMTCASRSVLRAFANERFVARARAGAFDIAVLSAPHHEQIGQDLDEVCPLGLRSPRIARHSCVDPSTTWAYGTCGRHGSGP